MFDVHVNLKHILILHVLKYISKSLQAVMIQLKIRKNWYQGTNASPPPWVYPKSLIIKEVKCISQREMGIENLVIITGIP